jgi:hypothetical protein
MQVFVYELRRIPLPRTPVNKGKKERKGLTTLISSYLDLPNLP